MRVSMPVCRPEDILKVSIPLCIETQDLSVNLEMTVYRSGWLTRELSRLSLLPQDPTPSFFNVDSRNQRCHASTGPTGSVSPALHYPHGKIWLHLSP